MAVPGYVLKNKRTTLERADRFISSKYFTDCNLFGRLYSQTSPVKSIEHFAAAGRITFDEAVEGNYEQTKVGETFGPTWSTHWFRVECVFQKSWLGLEIRLRWNSESEAMVWRDGKPLQGLSNQTDRTDFILTKNAKEIDSRQTIYIEMACNGLFGAGAPNLIAPPDPNKTFALKQCELAVRDHDIHQLQVDIHVLMGMVKHLPEESHRAYQALYAMNDIINGIKLGNRASYKTALERGRIFFGEKNGATQHTIHAVGNCHIDSAWLWPYSETIRKCARSWSATIRLMEKYPDLTFACSQAQQFEWVKIHYPGLYAEIKKYVSEGRFIPVGSVWVEMDGNLPSGEGFVRQFLYGQRFFEKEFGTRCKEFWLPDTFGYSAQLPQIMQLAGVKRFITQKISWNLVNKFPHHTFYWEGIDNSKVLSHFPPGDSYTMNGEVEEIMKTMNNFADKGRSNHTLYLYGHGDGGQGPDEDMIERLQRMEDVDGLPKVSMSTPDKFMTAVEENTSQLCKWSGELFLEFHNGTYTTQAKTKKGNRRCEYLLQDVEALCSLAFLFYPDRGLYPKDEIDRLWKLLLLNQFHDVLPGTSINTVYEDALEYYRDIRKSGNTLLQEAMVQLLSQSISASLCTTTVFNTLCWDRQEVVVVRKSDEEPPAKKRNSSKIKQIDSDGKTLMLATAPSVGYATLSSILSLENQSNAKVLGNGDIEMTNELVKVVLDPLGRVKHLHKVGCEKDGMKPDCLGNQFVIFEDIPLFWDAWDVMDYHLETRQLIGTSMIEAVVLDNGPLRSTVKIKLRISEDSHITQYIILDACCPYVKFRTEVLWQESHRFLKVEFPLNVITKQATYEIQFGHLQRTTHMNTSWDWAQYEVCGHKWADLSEYDWGVSVLNDSKYGWSAFDNVLRLSLLRSTKNPDEKADMGIQTFTYAIMPHTGTFQEAGVIQAAHELNRPLHLYSTERKASSARQQSFFQLSSKQVILDTIKQAEDFNNCLVLRMYEAHGGSTNVSLTTCLPVKSAKICNVMEDPAVELVCSDGHIMLTFTPFQVVTIMLQL